jgi:hypothetical protein
MGYCGIANQAGTLNIDMREFHVEYDPNELPSATMEYYQFRVLHIQKLDS